MATCTRKGCNNEAGTFKTCEYHRAKQRESNAKFWGKNPLQERVCTWEGCKEVIPSRSFYCEEHRKANKLVSRQRWNDTAKAKREKPQDVAAAPAVQPKARPVKAKGFDLAAEDARLRKVRERLNPDLIAQRMLRGSFVTAVY